MWSRLSLPLFLFVVAASVCGGASESRRTVGSGAIRPDGGVRGPEAGTPPGGLSPLRVSDDRRTLVRTDARSFFWLGDTAWELCTRLTREEARDYLTIRRGQGFTVIQAWVLSVEGHGVTNRYGEVPFSKVAQQELIPNEAYFQHVDWLLDEAEAQGIYVVLLPVWGSLWRHPPESGDGRSILTPANAFSYGKYLGLRYRERLDILWALGGDRSPTHETEVAVIEGLAAGLKAGGSTHPITCHPAGTKSSSEHFHQAAWLDFNMAQSAHRADSPVWDLIGADWRRKPVKPAIDGESLYENIPTPLWRHKATTPHSTAYEVRRPTYASVFSGAFGHTYGANGVFQFHHEGGPTKYYPTAYWREAIHYPGAKQMGHVRALMESRPLSGRIPDQDLLGSDAFAGRDRVTATRAADGSFAMIYSAGGQAFNVRLDRRGGLRLSAWWFNPRTGEAILAGRFDRAGERTFTPPAEGEERDWVLVLDDEAREFPPPGQRQWLTEGEKWQ